MNDEFFCKFCGPRTRKDFTKRQLRLKDLPVCWDCQVKHKMLSGTTDYPEMEEKDTAPSWMERVKAFFYELMYTLHIMTRPKIPHPYEDSSDEEY